MEPQREVEGWRLAIVHAHTTYIETEHSPVCLLPRCASGCVWLQLQVHMEDAGNVGRTKNAQREGRFFTVTENNSTPSYSCLFSHGQYSRKAALLEV